MINGYIEIPVSYLRHTMDRTYYGGYGYLARPLLNQIHTTTKKISR
jgi:hypothetical protein